MIQIFGVLGYGEVEFVLSMIKILACIGFIIFGIVVNCGGVPSDDRGYIGARYWHDPGAFKNGFKGFCTYVFWLYPHLTYAYDPQGLRHGGFRVWWY